MKKLVFVVLGLGVVVGAAIYMNRPPSKITASESVAESAAVQMSQNPAQIDATQEVREASRSVLAAQPSRSRQAAEQGAASLKSNLEAAALNQAIDILVSGQSTYAQKQAAWKQLLDGGKIDKAISELEQRTSSDPRVAEYPAALGQAYLKKCATIQDVREQGILAMQADKVFDTALNLDPSNWEARFTKAVALSYWPANMNKGEEVIQHFQTLIQQQEAQAPQPHFAETYAWLGEQYQKSGHSDYARTVWERGASLFPSSDSLKAKLATAGAAPVSASTVGQ